LTTGTVKVSSKAERNLTDKNTKYNELVKQRKACLLCKDELCNPAKVDGYDKFDREIGPWSRWQGNLDADLMIVGQDWGTVKLLRDNYLIDDGDELESQPTSKRLFELVNGIRVTKRPLTWKLLSRKGELFFTNAILCLKENDTPMQGKVKSAWFDNCVGKKKFLRQQIEIVNPKVVVGLGRRAFGSILRSFDLASKFPPSMKLSEIVRDKKGIELPGTRARAFAVYHPGAAGWNINRTKRDHQRDWERIRFALGIRG
jgi:DNA polymerase